jgi:hypothetical protein
MTFPYEVPLCFYFPFSEENKKGTMKKILGVIIIFAFMLPMSALAQEQDSEASTTDTRVITGTVCHFSQEGGFYGIEGDDGEQYKPLNLSEGFQMEGLRIKVMARLVRGKLLTHGWGIPIEILDIEKQR